MLLPCVFLTGLLKHCKYSIFSRLQQAQRGNSAFYRPFLGIFKMATHLVGWCDVDGNVIVWSVPEEVGGAEAGGGVSVDEAK